MFVSQSDPRSRNTESRGLVSHRHRARMLAVALLLAWPGTVSSQAPEPATFVIRNAKIVTVDT